MQSQGGEIIDIQDISISIQPNYQIASDILMLLLQYIQPGAFVWREGRMGGVVS